MLRLTAQYADLWNTATWGAPETMAEPFARIGAACREVGPDPETFGVTALISLWFPDLQQKSRPSSASPSLALSSRSRRQCAATPTLAAAFRLRLTHPKHESGSWRRFSSIGQLAPRRRCQRLRRCTGRPCSA